MTEKVLLEQILNTLNMHTGQLDSLASRLDHVESKIDSLHSDLAEFRTESNNNYRSLYKIAGELQGDIEEIQCDSQYIAMKRMLESNKLRADRYKGNK